MKEDTFIERRKEYRLPLDQKTILTDGKRSVTAYSANLSRGGLFLLSLEPFSIDTKVWLAFMLPAHSMSLCLKGRVAHIVFDKQRCEIDCGMGVQFIDVGESHKSLINLHILNEKMAYLELKKLLLPAKPNLSEVERLLKTLPALRATDLSALRYRVNRICTIFEPTPSVYDEITVITKKIA